MMSTQFEDPSSAQLPVDIRARCDVGMVDRRVRSLRNVHTILCCTVSRPWFDDSCVAAVVTLAVESDFVRTCRSAVPPQRFGFDNSDRRWPPHGRNCDDC